MVLVKIIPNGALADDHSDQEVWLNVVEVVEYEELFKATMMEQK